MEIPSIKELVAPKNKVKFLYYQKKELWYEITTMSKDMLEFKFPVPIDDTGDGRFEREDKALLYMRWIRIHRDNLIKELSGA